MEKYDIKKVVGEGSYGKAILCRRKVDSKMCIIKQISIKKLSKKEALLTEQEATLLKRLQHPNIVTFWESFFGNNNLHIVMEYADGGDLDHYIKAHAKSVPRREIPEKQVVNMFVQLSLAIKHIHDRKILHRDLKSQNVFLTSSGQLKLGDFGVSRVLRHTVELAATQIGTPYYMSPEIMDNQRYNSKTDIWSLGCILYELMCLRLPFDGASMKQLCYNIIKVNPVSPSMVYSPELRELVRDTLHKNPKTRPGINSILSRPIMRSKISALLGETKRQAEFSHTVLHGANVLSGQPPPGAPPPQSVAAAYRQPAPAPSAPAPVPSLAGQRPSSAAGYAAGRPSSAGPVPAPPAAGALRGPPVVASSAAQQAVAMLQAQRQQQILRQQQQLAQQQQYVGAMAAQMKAQIDQSKQAEVARVKAMQQQQQQRQAMAQAQEEEQRRARQQAEARARDQQSRAAEAQRQYDQKRAAEEQADRMKRAVALLDQQKALEKRRQERIVEEARKIKDEERARLREEERARQKAQAAQAAQAQARAAASSPALDNGAGGGAGARGAAPSAIYIPSAVPAMGRRPSIKPPIPANTPANQVAQAAPVRQFSAAALLARRRHSAPEKPPSPFNAAPSPQPAPSPVPVPVPMTAAALRARAAGRTSPSQPPPQPQSQDANPFKAVVETRSDKAAPPPWMKQPSRNSPNPHQQQPSSGVDLVVVGARASPAPSPSHPPLAAPSPAGREPARALVRDASKVSMDGIATPRAAPFSPVPASSPGPGFSPNDRRVAVDSALSKVQDVLQAVQGLNMKGRRADGENRETASSDSSSSYGSIQPATPSSAVPASVVQKVSDAAPGQNGSRSGERAEETAATGEAAPASPWLSDLVGQMGQLKFQMKNLQQLRSPAAPSAASPHSFEEDEDVEGEEDYNSSLSSITTSNTPVHRDRGPIPVHGNRQFQRNPPSQPAKAASQRTSYPLSADSSMKRSKALEEAEGFAVEKGLHPSASKESLALASRKESRARHNEDFRAFVQAQKQLKQPPGSASSANTHDTASTAAGAASNPPPVAKRPAFTPLSHHRASSGDGEDDEGSEHGSLASVSSYSVPSSESSPDKQQPAKQAPGGLHIKVPHPHTHAHNHKIQPAAKAAVVPRKDPVIKESASAGRLRAPVSAPSHAQAPRRGASSSSSVASAGSAVSARSSPSSAPASAVSPRNAAGFNVEEYRSQRDAERREMRQLMADRKKQLQARRIDSQPATPLGAAPPEEEVEEEGDEETEIAVLVPARPPTKPFVFTPSPQKEVDVSNLSLQYTMEVDISHDHDHEQSRIFALLESGIQVAAAAEGDDLDGDLDEEEEALEQSFAQLLLDERGSCDELGLTAGHELEYSVLIEQMQQILRKPTVKGMPHAPHKHAPPLHQLGSIAEEGTLPPTPSSARGVKLSPGRALAGELMMEDECDDDGEEQSRNNECVEGEEVEDPDEFEEEDLMILEELDMDGDLGGEEGREVHSRDGDNEGGGAFADEDFDSEDELGEEGEGEEEEEGEDDDDGFDCLDAEGGIVDYSASHDPFLLPLMPALLTADMALLDPATRIAAAAAAAHEDAQRPAYATPEKKTDAHHHHHLHHVHSHDRSATAAAGKAGQDEAASRRLQIAELQEYLVEKLGSAKVSEALHLLTISTEATLLAPQGTGGGGNGAGGGSPDRPDNYYDERDEELLNRIEDILGVDCLHYLDDMFMLLTLQ